MTSKSKAAWLGIIAVIIVGFWTLSLGASVEPEEEEIDERQSLLNLKAASFEGGLRRDGFDVIGRWAGDSLSPRPFRTEEFAIPSDRYMIAWYLDEWHPVEGDCIFSINVLDENGEFDHVILLFDEDDGANVRPLESGIYSLNIMSTQCDWVVLIAVEQN